ncbi:MAG: hypothetical protein U0798_20755 [Gemmataceae bacterium]
MSELFDAARPFLARLTARLENHPDLRQELAAFARAAASFLEGVSGPAPVGGFPAPTRPFSPVPGAASPTAYRYGAAAGFDPGAGTFEAEREQVALPIMAKRCRVKAEACRILVKRYSGTTSETDESVPLFKKAAELPDCGLWMLTGSGFNITPGVWENLAGAYEAAAVACELMDKVLPRTDTGLEIGLNLAAESQSTLLYAVVDTGRRGPDTDQIELFIRIRETGAQRRIYIPKYLKRDDRADPDNWRDVLARLTREYEPYKNGTIPPVATAEVVTGVGAAAKAKAPDKSMHSVQYHLKKVKESPSTANWPWIFKLIDETLESGLTANDAGLRDLFIPVADAAPDDVEIPPRVVALYREIDRHLATHPAEERVAPETPSQETVKAAVLLGGKEVAMVGGALRLPQQKAIIEAFDLRDLRWIPAIEPGMVPRYEQEIARPDVAVVLYAMRWTGAEYDEVKALCDKHRKPLVKLPRGYNPNQIASELLRQAGERLRNG